MAQSDDKRWLATYDILSYNYDKASCSQPRRADSMDQAHLTKAELALMELLWEAERRTARDLREVLYPRAEKAQHGTVQRLLQRLEDKGYVVRDRDLSVHLFSAAIGREAYAGRQLESLANQLTGGSIAPLLTHLIAEKKLGAGEIQRLRNLLNEDHDAEDDRG